LLGTENGEEHPFEVHFPNETRVMATFAFLGCRECQARSNRRISHPGFFQMLGSRRLNADAGWSDLAFFEELQWFNQKFITAEFSPHFSMVNFPIFQ